MGLVSDIVARGYDGIAANMADFNANSQKASQSTESTVEQFQSTITNNQTHRSSGLYRTESGRETYYPDGHEEITGPLCQHEEHTATPALPVSRQSYGFFPQTDRSTHQSSSSHDAPGAGLFGGPSAPIEQQQERNTHGTEEIVPFEKVESSASSSSSTKYGSGDQKKRSASSSDEHPGPMLRRRTTRSEIDDEGRRELNRIFTTQSQVTRQMSIAQPGDASVDPASESFDLTKFLRLFRHQLEGEGVELKRLSVVYRNLNVFGSGKALQLQKTVSDIAMAPFRMGEYFGKSERKQILHGFDGIIKAGELCVVLGRPGSGCSTLLKALTGELHGLETDESVIHYNGISQKRMIKEFKGETIYNQVRVPRTCG